MFAGKKSAQIREILISESAWEEMTCLFAPSQSVGNSVTINPKEKNYLLVGQVKYKILSLPKYQHLEFSEPVYIEKRKDILGGYGYWTKETILYPGESLSFITSAKNNLRKRDD